MTHRLSYNTITNKPALFLLISKNTFLFIQSIIHTYSYLMLVMYTIHYTIFSHYKSSVYSFLCQLDNLFIRNLTVLLLDSFSLISFLNICSNSPTT